MLEELNVFYKVCKVVSVVSRRDMIPRGSQALVIHVKKMERLDSIPRPMGSPRRL